MSILPHSSSGFPAERLRNFFSPQPWPVTTRGKEISALTFLLWQDKNSWRAIPIRRFARNSRNGGAASKKKVLLEGPVITNP